MMKIQEENATKRSWDSPFNSEECKFGTNTENGSILNLLCSFLLLFLCTIFLWTLCILWSGMLGWAVGVERLESSGVRFWSGNWYRLALSA